MSFEITTAFVEGYKSNIIMLSQQMDSRLFSKARQESQNSKADFYERIGAVDAVEITGRHGDTPIMNTPHSRRMVTLTDAEYGDMIDSMDRVRLLINPDDAYVRAAVVAMNRYKDDKFIAAILGNAYAGESGSTAVALPSAQKVAAHDGTTTTGVNLNVQTLRAVAKKFDGNDIDEMDMKYFAFTSSQKESLLAEEEVTSSDYAAIKALVSGQIDTFMGFKFVRSERLVRSATDVTYTVTNGVTGAGTGTITAANSRRCFAWVDNGMLSATGKDTLVKVQERADKRFGTQIYCALSVGCTRLEDEKVVEVICSE